MTDPAKSLPERLHDLAREIETLERELAVLNRERELAVSRHRSMECKLTNARVAFGKLAAKVHQGET